MIGTIQKILAAFTALMLAVFGAFGFSGSINDDCKQYKNVILMIGDGMGENALAAARQKTGAKLNMDSMPVHGASDTRSFILDSTDSAAGGSALACGVRVWYNSVAMFPFNPLDFFENSVPLSLTELAKENGKSAGVVTTDSTSGATPAAFSAHELARQNEPGISADQLKSSLDLLWGCESNSITKEKCEKNGFTFVSSRTDMLALSEGSRSFAQFNFSDMKNCENNYDSPSLAEMTAKAADLLEKNENGFFLMVEGACIDKFSHDNDLENAVKCVSAFDEAVKTALDFAAKDGETLVVVTADHETGGLMYDAEKDEFYYTSGDHTTANVPVFASADDAGFTDGQEVENRQISVQLARVMGFGKTQFPAVRPNAEK